MKLGKFIRRFLVPGPAVTAYYLMKYGCKISPKAEVDLTDALIIGKNTEIGAFTKIKAYDGQLRIGANGSISTGCFISSCQEVVEIGDYCMIGPNASIIGNNYHYDRLDIPILEQGITSKGIKIGKSVWIGAGACILDGSEIGDNVIITPNSVVLGQIPENMIVGGNPAKVIPGALKKRGIDVSAVL